MSKLNKDILFLIFEELQDDSKSLFSCLMINRLWCETVIPILWRNPWRYSINYNNKNYLLAMIAFNLPDDIKEFLNRQGIKLPSILHQSLLFDYLSFCKSININIMNSIICIGSSFIQFSLQQEFYNLIMRKCSELKYLDMRSIKHQIFYLPEAKTRLESLCELKCETTIDYRYFYGLARICQNIQRLIIINIDPNINYSGLVKLIEVQKNLKYFEWRDDFLDNNLTGYPYEEIFLILEKKADSLNNLIIYLKYHFFAHSLLQRIILKFHKLKMLTINEYVFISKEPSKMLIYPDLKILYIDYITISAASSIIENSGGNLKEILLFKYFKTENNFNEESLNFIRNIYRHCPLVKYLSLLFSPSKEHFTEFEKLLKVCQNLKSLLIILFNNDEIESYGKIMENGEELLKALIRSAPNNLKEIRFFDHFKFSLKALEEFFENWRGRPALSILTSDNLYRGDDYIKLINEYKNDGIIKDFRFVSRHDMY